MVSYYQTAEWKMLRAYAIEDAGGKCERCGSQQKLHVHHKFGLQNKFELEVLCAECHAAHHGRPELAKTGKGYYERILNTFEELGTKASDWMWNGEQTEAEGPCDLCGCDSLVYAFPIVSSVETGRQVLMVGSECVRSYTNVEEKRLNRAIGRAKKAKKLAEQCKISSNEAEFILSEYKDRLWKENEKFYFIALSGFLFETVHDDAKARLYEISHNVAQILLDGAVTEIEPGYLKNFRKTVRKQRLAKEATP